MAKLRSRPRRTAGFGRTVRNLLLFLLLTMLLAGAVAVGLVYWELTANLPPVEKLSEYRPPVATQVLADDGTVVGEFYFERRYVVPIERIPDMVRNAFIAAEDAAFYRHHGIDPMSIVRAVVNDLVAGGKIQGGSTITQQVVKSLLLTPRKSYERKLKEMVLALRLERQLSKDQILALYLNHIYLGSGAYGVAAAAEEYFGKRLAELTLAEAALLAGLPQAPSRYSPFKHWPRAKARQHYVLERMVEVGLVTPARAAAAAREPLALASRRGSYIAAPYYVEHVRRLLEQKYGETALYTLGLRVHTGLNLRMQRAAEAALREGLNDLAAREHYDRAPRHIAPAEKESFLRGQRNAMGRHALERGQTYEALVTAVTHGVVHVQVGAFHGVLRPAAPPDNKLPESYRAGDVVRVRLAESAGTETNYEFVRDREPAVQGALVAFDPGNGAVKALIGGYDFDRSQFNRAVQGARQPGSAFKPLIYAAAVDSDFTPASIIVDEPISFQDHNAVWMPHNYEEKYFGPTTLREALTFSRNVVTVKLTTRVGVKNVIKYVRNLGIQSPMAANLSLALGSSEVTLLELAAAYGVFANQGQRVEPRCIIRVTDSQGNVLDENIPQTEQVISPETAYLITSMLQSVIDHGTGRQAKTIGRPAAGKTGTTNDMNDAWFIGYTPQLLAGLWIGFDEKRSLGKGETGGHVAAPIWARFMERALENEPILDFPVAAGISFALVNPHTGQRIAPGSGGGMLECFRRGTEPPVVAVEPVKAAPAPDREPFRDSD